MNTLTPPQQISPPDRWLSNLETLQALEAPFKSAHILNNKRDHRYCPDFPRPVNGKWLASAVFKYIDSKRVISQPPAAIGQQKDRRVVAVLASILCREWRGLVCSLLLSYFFVYICNRIITAIVMPQFCHNELWQMGINRGKLGKI